MNNTIAQQNMATMKMTARHYWIVFVASLGQLIGTAVATVAGVIIPMMNILAHPELSSFIQGLIGCIDLVGIAVGSVILGKLSDRYGYLLFFRLCPVLVLISSVAAILFPNVTVLIISLFFIGFGIGGEYSLDSDYISVLMPVNKRSLMIGVAKTASAFGNIIAAAICFWMLNYYKAADIWPRLMWIIAIIAGLMIVLRIWFYQSPAWLLAKGDKVAAEKAVRDFLGKNVSLDLNTVKKQQDPTDKEKTSLLSFIRKYSKQVVLSGIPWACEGLGVYGIGVFLPILVMALGLEHIPQDASKIFHVTASVEVTFWISCIILPGFILGLVLINKKISITKIQGVGFWLCAASLVLLLLAFNFKWFHWISIFAFMCFELFLNMGPHLITYVLPPKIYPVQQRGVGVGIAAAIGKIGAVLGVFFIPVLLKAGGAVLVLSVSIAVMVIGALVTNIYGKKVLLEK